MVKRGEPLKRKGRPGLLPPLGVNFDDALSALLKTPPPPKSEQTRKRARPSKRRKRTRG